MKKLFKIAFLNNWRRKSRTLLALSGIIIGIASIVMLVSIVDGVYSDMNETLSQMQGIMVNKKDTMSPAFGTLNIDYEQKLKTISGVKEIVPELIHIIGNIDNEQMDFQGMDSMYSALAVEPNDFDKSYFGALADKIIKGKELKNTDSKKVLISSKTAEELNKTVGTSINLDGQNFSIKGIFESDSSTTGNRFFMTPKDLRALYDIDLDQVSYFTLIPLDPTNTEQIITLVEFKYDDLQAISSQDLLESIGELLNNLKLLVILVALISSIVAGVGVINTMLMAVMERTQEIGTLKAVGWAKGDIIIMVVLEALFIGALGGVAGIILGVIGSYTIQAYGLTTHITFVLLLEVFLFALLLGLIGGIYLAWIASRLDPIEALRSE